MTAHSANDRPTAVLQETGETNTQLLPQAGLYDVTNPEVCGGERLYNFWHTGTDVVGVGKRFKPVSWENEDE